MSLGVLGTLVEDVTFYNMQCHHRVAVWKHHLGRQTSHSATHSSLSVMHQSQSTSLHPSISLSNVSPHNCRQNVSKSGLSFTVVCVLRLGLTNNTLTETQVIVSSHFKKEHISLNQKCIHLLTSISVELKYIVICKKTKQGV